VRVVISKRIFLFISAFIFFTATVNPLLAEESMLFGAKGGVPIVDPFVLTNDSAIANNYTFETKRFIGGPFFQLNLPLHIGFEADALYRRLHYESNPFLFNTLHASTDASSWEFPLMVRRALPVRYLHPYGGIGVSLAHVSGKTDFSNAVLQSREPLELAKTWNTGGVVAGGIDVRHGRFHYQPEIRYTRWATQTFVSGNGLFDSNLNSIDFLIGVAFGK
jgi:opacity protein-like surface antigen